MAEVSDVMPITGSGAKVAARLCNFATAKSFLLSAHQNFLDKDVATAIRSLKEPWVDLYGYASRAGDKGFNYTLSTDRLNSVKWRIEQYSEKSKFRLQTAYGESESGPDERNNDGYWRAVEVYVFGTQPPAPKPPEIRKVRKLDRREFGYIKASGDMPSGPPNSEKDAINDVLKFLIDAGKGKFSEEGSLGSEDKKRRLVSEVPAGHRVNKVTIDTSRSFSTFPGGNVVQESTTILYEWGVPEDRVEITRKFKFRWEEKVYPEQVSSAKVNRREAERLPLVVPPDPE